MEQPRTNTYQYGLIEIVVHRPALDDKERQKREETLRRAVTAFGKETIRKAVNEDGKMAPVHG